MEDLNDEGSKTEVIQDVKVDLVLDQGLLQAEQSQDQDQDQRADLETGEEK